MTLENLTKPTNQDISMYAQGYNKLALSLQRMLKKDLNARIEYENKWLCAYGEKWIVFKKCRNNQIVEFRFDSFKKAFDYLSKDEI